MKIQTNNPRVLAVQTLARVKDGAYSNLQLNQVIKKHDLSDADRRLLTTLVYGVIQHRLTLAYWLEPFVANKKLDDWVRELLYTALFQMQYLDKIPQHAVFNESIEVAKILGHVGIRKFVTGILHDISRKGLRDISAIEDNIEALSVKFSLPIWLIKTLIEQNGLTETQSMLATINDVPRQSVRVNTVLSSVDDVTLSLENEGFSVKKSEVARDALVISGGYVAGTKAYQSGWITIQDESAMLPVESLQLNQHVKTILDAAAAPGGKTTQMAQMISSEASITALDMHQHKVKLIQDNAKRLGVGDRVEALSLDARDVPSHFAHQQFDRILVDAPCSGLGLLRRKPEIRYDKTLADVNHLAELQLEILSAVSQNLAKNGIMVYSTCTILQQENDNVVNLFLKEHPDFELVRTQTAHNLKADREEMTLQIYPHDYHTDGFFVATFQKIDVD
ncbi:MAG: 16S rRNA (cytosine(967)-C(5))-methyltransferase RsmB [Leuconostoc fallax]